MTIDDIFASMPEEDAATGRDYLVIDPAARSITVPESEKIFGVEGDEDAARKYFICPRYVGDNLDLAGMFLTVYWRNANGDADGYLVNDAQIDGDYVTFSWLLGPEVVAYKGAVQFSVCADLPNTPTKRRPDWNTTTASGEVLEGQHPDLGDVAGETSDVVTQLRAEIQASTAAVEAAGAAQVDVVKAQGTNTTQEAVAAIQAQGEATRASIPADYTTLAGTVDRLTRDRAAAIVCEAAGAAIQVQDASNDPLQGLRIFGRSTQDGTPTPEAPVEIVSTPAPVVGVYGKNLVDFVEVLEDGHTASINGLTATQKGGVVTVGGKNTSTTWTNIVHLNNVWPSDKYCFPAGTYSTHKKLSVCIRDIVLDAPRNISGTFTAENPFYIAGFYIAYAAGETANDEIPLVFAIGPETPTAYEPHKEAQRLTITTPGSLPGIPVASGGNYTDAAGQEWVCDEVDLARGVYVQKIGIDVIDGTTKKVSKNSNAADAYLYYGSLSYTNKNTPGYCTHFGHVAAYPEKSDKTGRFNVSLANAVYFNGYGIVTGDNATLADPSEFNAWFAEQYEAGTPVKVYYAIANPIETALTDVELQAFLAMHSNKPTTTVLNDAGAHMVLEYAADPKTYIDNKLAALIAANN